MPGESAQKLMPQFDCFLFSRNAQFDRNCCYSVARGYRSELKVPALRFLADAVRNKQDFP
jgi:hypothetical protein